MIKNHRKPVLLSLLSVAILIVFFNIPVYSDWLTDKVINPLSGIDTHLAHMRPGQRLSYKLKSSYTISYRLTKPLRAGKQRDVLVLLPPDEYVRSCNIDYPVPEPAVFYYYTGIRSVGIENVGSDKADYTFLPVNGQLQLVRIDEGSRTSILALFRKYKDNP